MYTSPLKRVFTRLGARGIGLVELMIAVAILSIGVLGMIGALGYIQRAIQVAKSKGLASNLAQEKMQILKQKPYYQVLITTSVSYDPALSTPYDPSYFPPENILEGGINYQRLTYVQVAQETNGELEALAPTTPDTGMKLITVSVLWTEASQRKRLQVRSVMSNEDTVMSNAIFSGVVQSTESVAIQGALVNVAENVGWRANSNATGAYSINLSPGSYTMMASAPGYFSQLVGVSIGSNQSLTQNFSLAKMSSGTVSGTVWISTSLVISQVVVSTAQADINNFLAQYVELYNPTTAAVTVGAASPPIKVNFMSPSGCTNADTCAHSTYGIKLNYVNNTVGAGAYYLIANTATFTANGVTRTADAVYADDADIYCSVAPNGNLWNLGVSPPRKLIFNLDHGGSVWLTNSAGTILDAVGWIHNANTPSPCEGACINLGAAGFVAGMQAVRITSPSWTAADLDTYGNAYDSDFNMLDISTRSIDVSARTTSVTRTKVAGKPAIGAVVSASDGLSSSTAAYALGSPPRAVFTLQHVATGTWSVFLASSAYFLENTTITIAGTGSTYSFPSSTTFLDSENVEGFVSGTVTDAAGVPINPAIVVSPNGAGPDGSASTASGQYLLRVSSGYVDVTANPGSVNPTYITQSSSTLLVQLGVVKSGVNFILSQGGRIQGFVTRDGTNALPGVAVAFLNSNGTSMDQQVSDSNGRFTSISIDTGTYYVTPVVGARETATPSSATVTVSAGATVFSSTFTIGGALGTVRGSVTAGGQAIRTGVLVIVTTTTIASAPPALSTATLTGAPYYIGSSYEDGTYSIEVPTATYRVYAYYTTFSGQTPTISPLSTSGISVTAGQTTTVSTFAW